jgi:hypothetical protein
VARRILAMAIMALLALQSPAAMESTSLSNGVQIVPPGLRLAQFNSQWQQQQRQQQQQQNLQRQLQQQQQQQRQQQLRQLQQQRQQQKQQPQQQPPPRSAGPTGPGSRPPSGPGPFARSPMPPRPNGPPIAMQKMTPGGSPTYGRNIPPQRPGPMVQQQGTRLAPVRQSQALVQGQRGLPATTLRSNTMTGPLAKMSILRLRLLASAAALGVSAQTLRPALIQARSGNGGGRSNDIRSLTAKFNQATVFNKATGTSAVISSSKLLFFRDARLLQSIDKATGGHAFSLHGAQTTLSQQKDRAKYGKAPDGRISTPVNSTKFLTNADHLNAYRAAIRRYRAAGSPKYFNCRFTMPKEIGEGYFAGGEKYAKTAAVFVLFSKGQIRTMYPDIR